MAVVPRRGGPVALDYITELPDDILLLIITKYVGPDDSQSSVRDQASFAATCTRLCRLYREKIQPNRILLREKLHSNLKLNSSVLEFVISGEESVFFFPYRRYRTSSMDLVEQIWSEYARRCPFHYCSFLDPEWYELNHTADKTRCNCKERQNEWDIFISTAKKKLFWADPKVPTMIDFEACHAAVEKFRKERAGERWTPRTNEVPARFARGNFFLFQRVVWLSSECVRVEGGHFNLESLYFQLRWNEPSPARHFVTATYPSRSTGLDLGPSDDQYLDRLEHDENIRLATEYVSSTNSILAAGTTRSEGLPLWEMIREGAAEDRINWEVSEEDGEEYWDVFT